MKLDVQYIKDHVSSNLSFQPELKQQVAKTLLALLKIRHLDELPCQNPGDYQ